MNVYDKKHAPFHEYYDGFHYIIGPIERLGEFTGFELNSLLVDEFWDEDNQITTYMRNLIRLSNQELSGT